MSLVKRTYVDQETVITAENLNAIQDAIIENEEAIGGKYNKPAGGIPASDTASGVQTSLGKADSAYQKPSGGIPATDMASGVQTSLGKADSAYQKPSGGISATDMASGVQTSLGKADSAYQKPSGGIPATDMASGVQTSLGKADSSYQKPSGGIPASDMASAVQTSLGKADSAYQKPSGGIPSTDLASAVQTSLGKADTALQSSDIDSTLEVTGKAADAKKTGDEISDVKNTLNALEDDVVGENPISIAGTNTTGTTIKKGTFFYNNGELVYAKSDIANNDGITIGTNAENASTDGALNTLSSPLYSVKSSIEANSTVTITSSSSKYTIPNTFLRHSFYLIRGNVCYVNLVFDCVTPATHSEAIFSNMPIPLAASDNTVSVGHAQCWDYPDLVGPTILVQNKILYLRGGTTSRSFGLAFSYPVDM